MADLKISQLTGASTPLAGTEVVPVVQSGATRKVSIADLTAGKAVSALSFSATQGITGGSGFQISGFSAYRASGASTSSPGDASMYFNSATGQTLQARAGSSYDWSLINPGNANYIARVPTGTLNLELAGGNLAFSTSGKGIDFSATSGSGTSELLADYEEGTWTAKLYDASNGGNASATTATGYYTKIGNQVTLTVGNFNNIDTTGMTGGNFIRLGDLPFTPTSNSSGSMTVGTWNFDAGYTALIPVTVGTSSRLAFWQVGDNVVEVVGIGVSALTSGTSDIGRMTITYFV